MLVFFVPVEDHSDKAEVVGIRSRLSKLGLSQGDCTD